MDTCMAPQYLAEFNAQGHANIDRSLFGWPSFQGLSIKQSEFLANGCHQMIYKSTFIYHYVPTIWII